MQVTNHNNAPFGVIENADGYIVFYPKKDWNSGYSAFQLEQIAKTMRKLK